MLEQIYDHLIAPKLALASASAAARKRGLSAFQVIASNMAPTLEPKDIATIAGRVSSTRSRVGAR